MLRKTTAAVVLAGALALGTASATSLGTFNSPTFAASDVDLLPCEVGTDQSLLNLLPDVPDVNTTLNSSGDTLDVGTIDATPLADALAAISADCVTDTLADVVLLSDTGTVLDSHIIDPDAAGLDTISPSAVYDAVSVNEVRVVLRDA